MVQASETTGEPQGSTNRIPLEAGSEPAESLQHLKAQLQQLEQEKATLITEQRILEMEQVDAAASWERTDNLLRQSEEEVDTLRAALAETREALQLLQTELQQHNDSFPGGFSTRWLTTLNAILSRDLSRHRNG